jgi:hypothetical protein
VRFGQGWSARAAVRSDWLLMSQLPSAARMTAHPASSYARVPELPSNVSSDWSSPPGAGDPHRYALPSVLASVVIASAAVVSMALAFFLTST